MNMFNKYSTSHMGPGGFHCPCCNWTRGRHAARKKARQILKGIVRQQLKKDLKREVEML